MPCIFVLFLYINYSEAFFGPVDDFGGAEVGYVEVGLFSIEGLVKFAKRELCKLKFNWY